MKLKALTHDQIRQLADSGRIFQRGEAYHRSDAIARCTVSGDTIDARVRGSIGLYSVQIGDTDAGLSLRCDCPYEGDVCKHIVAVLLRYLEGAYEASVPPESGLPQALKRTLEGLSHRVLLDLVLELAAARADFRHILLERVDIPPQVLRQQPRQAGQVARLRQEVSDCFHDLPYRLEYDDPCGEAVPEETLEAVFALASALHPEDQLEVYWHVVVRGNAAMQEHLIIGTEQVERAVELYAAAVGQLDFPERDKRFHLDVLLDALSWPMCDYGDVAKALGNALEALCATEEDRRHLIRRLEASGYPEAPAWIAQQHLKLGEEDNYLSVRAAHLKSESDHVELAEFWERKGEIERAISVLESCLATLLERHAELGPYHRRMRPAGSAGAFEKLAGLYRERGADENLCRVLVSQARCEGATLALYREVESVAARLGTWPGVRDALLGAAKHDPTTRARIHFDERDWDAAIALAQERSAHASVHDDLRALVAEGVKSHRPEAAIELYQGLVQDCIDKTNRKAYQAAAGYAGQLKAICLSILDDPQTWQAYIDGLRAQYPRRRALQEELEGL